MYRESGIDLIVIQGFDHFADRHFKDSDFGKWGFFTATSQQPDELRLCKMVREADAQLPAIALFRGMQSGSRAFHERQHAAGFVPEYFTGPSELYASMYALEQRNLQVRFQFPDRSGKRRWLNMNLGCGAGKTLLFGANQKIT